MATATSAVVYVYKGPGANQGALNLLLSSLRRCLCPAAYSILPISPASIKQGDWKKSCAAIVFGGGYDLGFLKSLGRDGADEVRTYVQEGGVYIGLCAGAYFAADYIQFEKGTQLEVCGTRPLKFYPGKCQGTVSPNFRYNSEQGAAALPVTVPANTLSAFTKGCTLHAYINGGGFFSPYSSTDEFPGANQVETLAYFDSLAGQPAAVVKCEVGDRGGVALLSSLHIEFAAFELNPTDVNLMKIQRDLRNSDGLREMLFKSFLKKGNLRVRGDSLL